METNNVEMTPEVETKTTTIETNGFVGAVMFVGSVLAIVDIVLIPTGKWIKSKIDNCRKPKLQVVEDEE